MRNTGNKSEQGHGSAPGESLKDETKAEVEDREAYEKTIGQLTKELSNILCFISEGKLTALEILADLLPEFEPNTFGKCEPKVEAAVIRYARAHDSYDERWASVLIHSLKQCVNTMKEWCEEVRNDVLTKLTAETADLVQKRAQVQTAESRFASICEGLDLRTKFIITVGEELSALSGLNIECFADVWYGLRDDEIVAEVKKDAVLSKDDDIRFLCDSYQLAHAINSAG